MQSCTGKAAPSCSVEQAVVGVGQRAVVLEPRDPLAGQDRRQARVLLQCEAATQRIGAQAVHRDGAQVLFLQLQQRHRAAGEVGAQRRHEALQAHGRREIGGEVGEERDVRCVTMAMVLARDQ